MLCYVCYVCYACDLGSSKQSRYGVSKDFGFGTSLNLIRIEAFCVFLGSAKSPADVLANAKHTLATDECDARKERT